MSELFIGEFAFRYWALPPSPSSLSLPQDWSTDGRFIASVCLGYELLFHKIAPALKGSARENAPAVKNVQWATSTCKFGWAVNGIFRPDQVLGDGERVGFAIGRGDAV